MIVDGRAIAQDVLKEAAALGRSLVVRAVVVSPSPATESYLKVKSARAADAGMRLDVVELPDGATTEEVIAAVQAPGADSVIVQLPLPEALDQEAVLGAIPVGADPDVLSPEAYERFVADADSALLPPVVDAIKEIFDRHHVDPAGKRALVIGNGRLVGQPAFEWLRRQGADVVVVTRASEAALPTLLPEMDIVVSGAGSPGLILPGHLKEGVVLVDAGTSESGGQIRGDADPACADKASLFTPVPGGVGPLAVACLFRNAAKLARFDNP